MHTDVRVKGVETLGSHRQYIRGGGGKEELSCSNCLSGFSCSGLITPSGLTSIPAGMETPDMIELRKRKNIEEAMESGAEQQPLYTVLPEKRVNVGAAMMGSAHVYDMASVSLTKGFSN